jgi:tRNA pseudouridine38-40 synthase
MGFSLPRNLKLTLAYDGSAFSGWQVQPGRRTVQGDIAAAIERITGEKLLPQGSGRTDAGVHALGQVASFSTTAAIPCENFVKAFNSVLPDAIRVLAVDEVPPEFHARHSAKAKSYRYRIYRDGICPPFLASYVTHHPYPLDEERMIASAGAVTGEHDFTSFAAVDPDRSSREINDDGTEETQNNIRTIYSSCFRRDDGNELIYEVRGNGFLHHMVRNLVGTFLLVGKGSLSPEDIPRILLAKNRSANPGATAPATGLYLVSVEY